VALGFVTDHVDSHGFYAVAFWLATLGVMLGHAAILFGIVFWFINRRAGPDSLV
jgi:hypothetical protein